jgi:hypothetical protein
MCTPQNSQIIDTVVKEFLDRGQAFTAFEVSLEAKKRGATERHRDMKNYIHQCPVLNDEMEFGNYDKTLVHVGNEGGQPLQAFLYHPKSYDASTYKPLERKGGSSQPAAVPSVPALAASTAGAVNGSGAAALDPDEPDDGSYAVDYRNRLMIPTKFLRGMSATPGELVHVYADTDGVGTCIFLSKTAPTGDGVTSKTQMVERNGDLRLSQTTLTGSGFTGNKFLIENSGSTVKVSAAV